MKAIFSYLTVFVLGMILLAATPVENVENVEMPPVAQCYEAEYPPFCPGCVRVRFKKEDGTYTSWQTYTVPLSEVVGTLAECEQIGG